MTKGRSEPEIWQALSEQAEKRYGKDRAAELKLDIEQVVGELCAIEAFTLRPDDEA